VEAGAEESLLGHRVLSLGIPWDACVPHADVVREACGSRHLTGVSSHYPLDQKIFFSSPTVRDGH
jgi:hypothetical protein